MNPANLVHETTMDSRTGALRRECPPPASDGGDICPVTDSYGHLRHKSAKLSREEPDAGNLHVRDCEG